MSALALWFARTYPILDPCFALFTPNAELHEELSRNVLSTVVGGLLSWRLHELGHTGMRLPMLLLTFIVVAMANLQLHRARRGGAHGAARASPRAMSTGDGVGQDTDDVAHSDQPMRGQPQQLHPADRAAAFRATAVTLHRSLAPPAATGAVAVQAVPQQPMPAFVRRALEARRVGAAPAAAVPAAEADAAPVHVPYVSRARMVRTMLKIRGASPDQVSRPWAGPCTGAAAVGARGSLLVRAVSRSGGLPAGLTGASGRRGDGDGRVLMRVPCAAHLNAQVPEGYESRIRRVVEAAGMELEACHMRHGCIELVGGGGLPLGA